LDDQDPDIPLFVPTAPHDLGSAPQLALSNSFGFGGHNAVLALRRTG
jgi:3-oxoacyl-[acyl-carrier-protein] synthase II